jgi:hypothetical protein
VEVMVLLNPIREKLLPSEAKADKFQVLSLALPTNPNITQDTALRDLVCASKNKRQKNKQKTIDRMTQCSHSIVGSSLYYYY